MRFVWLLATISVVLILLCGAGSAYADEPAIPRPASKDALDHLEKGNKLYKVRDFAQAAEEYKAGALIEQAPIFDYNLGQCYRQQGDYKAAIWHYKQFLKVYVTPGPRMETVQKFISEMQAELDQQAKKEEPTEAAPEQHSGSATEPPKTTSTPAPQPQRPIANTEKWYEDWFGWGMAGTGVIGVAVGGALLLDASSLNDEANRTASQQEAASLHDKADTRSLLGTVIGLGGVGLLATGAIKLAIHPHANETTTTAWGVSASTRGVFVFGRF